MPGRTSSVSCRRWSRRRADVDHLVEQLTAFWPRWERRNDGVSGDHLPASKGFSAAGVSAGLKGDEALDFALDRQRPAVRGGGRVHDEPGQGRARAARSGATAGRPRDRIRALSINTACANACTGAEGLAQRPNRWRAWAARSARLCGPEAVLVMSTGVIGTHLPMDEICSAVFELPRRRCARHGLADAARAILTTDTRRRSRECSVQRERHVHGCGHRQRARA